MESNNFFQSFTSNKRQRKQQWTNLTLEMLGTRHTIKTRDKQRNNTKIQNQNNEQNILHQKKTG